MNNLLAPFYELFFDWGSNQTLLNCVFNNNDYTKFGLLLLVLPILLLVTFYKLWDPIRKQRLMLAIVFILITIITYGTTYGILNNNSCILNEVYAYTGDSANPNWFIQQMCIINLVISLVLTFLFSIGVKRISTQNSHNPF